MPGGFGLLLIWGWFDDTVLNRERASQSVEWATGGLSFVTRSARSDWLAWSEITRIKAPANAISGVIEIFTTSSDKPAHYIGLSNNENSIAFLKALSQYSAIEWQG